MKLPQGVPAALVALLITGCAPALVSGCAHIGRADPSATVPTLPTGSSHVPLPTHLNATVELATVSSAAAGDANPGDVARAAVAILNVYDTRTDTSPAAAAGRASLLLTPALSTELSAGESRTDSTWLDLEQHDGYTSATVDLADEYGQPATTSTTAYVQVSVVLTLTGRDSWFRVQAPQLVRVTLIRHTLATGDRVWLVDGFPT